MSTAAPSTTNHRGAVAAGAAVYALFAVSMWSLGFMQLLRYATISVVPCGALVLVFNSKPGTAGVSVLAAASAKHGKVLAAGLVTYAVFAASTWYFGFVQGLRYVTASLVLVGLVVLVLETVRRSWV
ncbi:hypothetical protein [Haloarchaeobius sp. DFWS5]|uniref:hypothetical protein n=1 Tax=Haloarchaeobius sp. DFWS5 TaxID=3446114 RepID=UPI003EBBFD86